MPLYVRYLCNIVFTSLVLYVADWSMYQRMSWWQDVVVAVSIILVAAVVTSARMPAFFLFVAQFPLSIALMLSFFAWDWQEWVYTYVIAMVCYIALHIILSSVLRYHWLLPGWNVRHVLQNKGSSS